MEFLENSINEFLVATASRKPTPGGGSAAALAGSLAASLLEMVCHLSDTEQGRGFILEAKTIRLRLGKLIDEDANSFKDFLKAPAHGKEEALKKAALIPLETATLSFSVLELAGEIIRICKKSVLTDAGTAAVLADAAVQSACFNVNVNLNTINDARFRETVNKKLKRFSRSATISRRVTNYVNTQLKPGTRPG